jgi:hypothetical protein
MLLSTSYKINRALMVAAIAIAAVSCKKDGNPNNLPSVSTATYEGTIDGYKSSDEVYPDNLIAYWSFDDTKNELKSSTAPTSSANDTYVAAGVRGKALNLNAGYLYYATQFQAFKTAALKSFTISTWVKILNNGSKRTMLFQLARPGIFNGNINFALNTQSFPATTTNTLRIQPTFMTVGGGTQDNLNSTLSPVIGMDKWTHIVLTYETNTGVFDIWADGVKVGAFPNRGVGNNLFNAYEPSEIIIGSNYNGIPGKSVSTDVSFAPMTGQIDEVRIYNRALPDAQVKSLFNLGKANK